MCGRNGLLSREIRIASCSTLTKPAESAFSIREYLAELKIPVPPPPLPDLTFTDFYLFPKLKVKLKGKNLTQLKHIG